MSELFRRRLRVTVGEFEAGSLRPEDGDPDAATLRIAAKVEKNRAASPNRTTVEIYNLSKDRRGSIQKNDLLVIEAGYADSVGQIFQGDITEISHVRSGANWITKLMAGDGTKAFRSARCSESFAPGTKADQVIRKLVNDYGLKLGNAEKMLQKKAAITEYLNGKVLHGQVHQQLERILKDVGLEYSIQDGTLQLIEIGRAFDGAPVMLDPSSGLIGSPEFGETGEGANKVVTLKVKSLLHHGIVPGRLIDLQSETKDAIVRVDKLTHTVDNYAQAFYTDVQASVI